MPNLILFNKPFNVLSQFSAHEGKITLAKFIKTKGFHPAGRLDYDSEGLMLLTNEGPLQHQISHPNHKLPKTYWIQVEGEVTKEALEQLRSGVKLSDGMAAPAKVKQMASVKIWPRNPPIRPREGQITSWIQVTIVEGRNRQVRRMAAAVGLPCLRLIRMQIGEWSIKGLKPGESRTDTVALPSESVLQATSGATKKNIDKKFSGNVTRSKYKKNKR
ncbi:MAG: pseudouridine synthase [Oleispira antarctica]|uniref:Pseudouridine synthase n=1 Tax=Oleispira antarctica RB-8 TaxID=698738 RepID=R4YS17_OLEAN|nr:pseudouridine synthase [Oleispira antarctica]MBQ0792751.1 pseudouridine synthase [Oleispira antarctica]CCK76038.1 Ribosomal large subunit pseudouridine synthase E [Oleispira antarctica RB-8]